MLLATNERESNLMIPGGMHSLHSSFRVSRAAYPSLRDEREAAGVVQQDPGRTVIDTSADVEAESKPREDAAQEFIVRTSMLDPNLSHL